MSGPYLILVSDAQSTCGVEAFSRLMADRLGARGRTYVLGSTDRSLGEALKGAEAIVLNFPIVAWKRRLFAPIAAAIEARLRGKDVLVVLHEWAALDWKRRVVLTPVVLLANRLLFSAPEVATEFGQSALGRFATRLRQVLPIPPNIVPPRQALPLERPDPAAEDQLVLGQFGSIYPKKQSSIVLEVAARLIGLGHDVRVIFACSFIKGLDNVEASFFETARTLGVADRVVVTGYIADEAELHAIFQTIDVFCYDFAEGLTSRRASVLAAALSGKPVVVNSPVRPDALAHHGLFQRLIETGALQLVPTDADVATLAQAVLAARESTVVPVSFDDEMNAVWTAIIDQLDRAPVASADR